MKINYEINPKIEVFYLDYRLSTNHEYTLEELNKQCNDYWILIQEQHKSVMQKEGYQLTRFTLEVVHESGYYNDDGSAEFNMKIYRTEKDKEYEQRLSTIKKERERRKIEKLAKEAKEFTKRIEHEKRMKDPEYIKLLELQKKFGK